VKQLYKEKLEQEKAEFLRNKYMAENGLDQNGTVFSTTYPLKRNWDK
jgi:hypothetical protein